MLSNIINKQYNKLISNRHNYDVGESLEKYNKKFFNLKQYPTRIYFFYVYILSFKIQQIFFLNAA